MSSPATNLNSSTVQEIVNWVTTADGCVHSADTTQLDFAVGKFLQLVETVTNSCAFRIHTRDPTRQLSRVGGVYWAIIHIRLRSEC